MCHAIVEMGLLLDPVIHRPVCKNEKQSRDINKHF